MTGAPAYSSGENSPNRLGRGVTRIGNVPARRGGRGPGGGIAPLYHATVLLRLRRRMEGLSIPPPPLPPRRASPFVGVRRLWPSCEEVKAAAPRGWEDSRSRPPPFRRRGGRRASRFI